MYAKIHCAWDKCMRKKCMCRVLFVYLCAKQTELVTIYHHNSPTNIA